MFVCVVGVVGVAIYVRVMIVNVVDVAVAVIDAGIVVVDVVVVVVTIVVVTVSRDMLSIIHPSTAPLHYCIYVIMMRNIYCGTYNESLHISTRINMYVIIYFGNIRISKNC